jgi:hypothetical protein
MKTVCAFCNTLISPGSKDDDPVSHGVCPDCYNRIFSGFGFNTKKFLDMLDAPVFLVDAEVNTIAANSLAVALIGKPAPRVHGELCGDVLECINACLPPGCGKTEFCPDCTFRNTVNETFATGKPVTRRPAILTKKTGSVEQKIPFLISTRKDGDVVLLRLELV